MINIQDHPEALPRTSLMTAILANTATGFAKNLGFGLAGTALAVVNQVVQEPRLLPNLLQASITGNFVGAMAFALSKGLVFSLEKRLIEKITKKPGLRKPLLIIAAVVSFIATLIFQILTFQVLRERIVGSLTLEQQNMFSLTWNYYSYPPGLPCEDCHAIRVAYHYLNSMTVGSCVSGLAAFGLMYGQVSYILLNEWKIDAAQTSS